MKAVRVHQYGSPEVMQFDDVERPEPGPGEVLVRVKAAGVGPWDAWIRSGQSKLPQPLPLTLGSDLSGVVEAIGATENSAFAVGDAVFGVTNPRFIDAYAEYAIAQAGMLARKPAQMTDIEAAAVPVVAVTAWQMLFEHAKVAAGQTVLIHGAAGSVGAAAVQLAREAQVRIIATVHTGDVDYVRGLGADTVIDTNTTAFEDVTGAETVDAVIDAVGGDTQRRSFAVLKRGGTLVSAVAPPDEEEAQRRGVHALFFLVDVTTARLTKIAELIEAGKLSTLVGTVLPLSAARTAHEMLDGTRPRPRGKIVLRVDDI